MNTSFERSSQKDEWLTPRYIIESLGPFDLDPCASVVRPWPTAVRHFTVHHNGLMAPWDGFVWCNPPYGTQAQKWMRRMAEHNNGIALTFARTETAMFFDSVWPKASAIFFIRRRLMFCGTDGKPSVNPKTGKPQGAGAPSCLIAYGDEARKRLLITDIDGRFVGLSR